MPTGSDFRLKVARSLDEALVALAEGGGARPFAGATWIMRAPVRGEELGSRFVAISRIDVLRQVRIEPDQIRIGACATHADIAQALAPLPDGGALAAAAKASANPAIRNVATLGGNLCAVGFAASDLIPALLVLDAQVELARLDGARTLPLAEFLANRSSLDRSCLVTAVAIPRSLRKSAHARLPLRKVGDYPVAIVSIAAEVGKDETIRDVRVAVGSVETVARRWENLERALEGERLEPRRAAEWARDLSPEFRGRDGVEAPGWYRLAVLPSLVRKALEALQADGGQWPAS